MNVEFAKDVLKGLSAEPKFLSSKYFYDKRGDELFRQIMDMPEYYLTDAENEIFEEQSIELVEALGVNGQPFDLYELGAGDGRKTIHLLRELKDKNFIYKPIDISRNTLQVLSENVQQSLPQVSLEPQQGEYFEVLKSIKGLHQKVILFLGSNIGNLKDNEANRLLKELSESMAAGDKLVLGVDLKKDADIILPAYNDKQGITRAFNLNLLSRINRELDANFNLEKFTHSPCYDEENGIMYSYIESSVNHSVISTKLNREFKFKKGEKIHTEISRKYDESVLEEILKGTNLKIRKRLSDKREYYNDVIIEKI